MNDLVLVERKDRSYEAGLADTREKRVRRVVEAPESAGRTMPREAGAGRVLIIGFQHLVLSVEAQDVDGAYEAALRDQVLASGTPVDDLPHVVIVEHLGLEPKSGGERSNFFSPQPLNPDPLFMARVGPLVVRALGVRL